MSCSPEKLAANKANAAQSTGPKTEAGKLASRRNALKHGLTGSGLALPDEDASRIEAAFAGHAREMNPKTRAGVAMVFTVALSSLRLERFSRAEAATLSQRVLDAGFAFDDAQVARRDEAKARLHQDPSAQLAVLSRFQLGVEWVMEAWEALACALTSGKIKNWRQPQFALFEALTGRSPEFPSYFDSTMWNLAARGDEGALDDPDLPGDSPAAKCRSARERLLAICDQEAARWEALLEPATAATATARANAIQAACHDDSKQATLARKYEAATRRDLHKALKEFRSVEAEFAEPEPLVETPETQDACVELGSFLPGPEPDPTPVEAETPQTCEIPGSDRFETASASIPGFETDQSRRI